MMFAVIFEVNPKPEQWDAYLGYAKLLLEDKPEGHPDRAACLGNLGIALQRRFGRTGDMEALTEAIRVGHDAVAATPSGHPNRAVPNRSIRR